MPQVNAFLKLRILPDEPIPITLDQARKLIYQAYKGSLQDEKQLAFNNLEEVEIILSHPMAESYGVVYMEIK